ncbi:MAG TPA: bifunctional DNA-formamidopyrimidine glycosylase/DNA-(apurinic or apyrimidinic site) lyase [Thiohalobacter sp.]|nr:bifunctional DNA-formamidopyrimidine glycosylase/DNA-(apurinic or apyrimidinic site) lyase [Thiohalobacter sp.]
MPELPEVETTRRGIEPHLLGRRIVRMTVRERRLRWPVPRGLEARLAGQRTHAVRRRAKYLLIELDAGTLILHLGMSGALRILPAATPPGKHDHLDLELDDGLCLRLTDPRRFGALLWTTRRPESHRLLRELGPEPLSGDFNGDYLFELSRGRRAAVKNFIMDSHVVVGVGNIYANEALYLAGIHPARAGGRISRTRYAGLASAIKAVLEQSIRVGGTTLRDFTGSDGRPGYFRQSLRVYERAGQLCPGCGEPIRMKRIGQRSSYYCSHCQR